MYAETVLSASKFKALTMPIHVLTILHVLIHVHSISIVIVTCGKNP